MSNIKAPPGMAECMNCDNGIDGFDEDGGYFPCYACGMSGWVPQAAADEINQARVDSQEYQPLRPQIIMQHDRESGDVYAIKRSILPWSLLKLRPVPVYVDDELDEIPF